MSREIIGLGPWLDTPPGRYLLAWERAQYDEAVADVFGYHALQLGLAELSTLAANRMPHRWLALAQPQPRFSTASQAQLITDFEALPFSEGSLDLVTLPHTLELSADPHGALREVERVLVPEGRVVLSGFNPVSLWGLRQRRARIYARMGVGDSYLPAACEAIHYWRMRDWLRLLGFEVESSRFGLYRPGVRSEAWLERFRWLDGLGERSWPIFGAAYFIVAVKRVRGMHLLTADWKRSRARAGAPVAVTSKVHRRGARAAPAPHSLTKKKEQRF
ncbi:class I SAM-dependent methyltransferase [Xenophilus arseniciresistens]|uniref:Class I SAM-dependent methyltransferase n=1 Tax=Xenophilus arseniciresistens TaxID=1283306 RepID=A0AAE3N8A7_9BURK|nr:class I SAM-dependent methyltransferase [Xenophilus arseniciresistens]MDA7416186.1 class I SAM-dependent methyltransferase [Xenophilus arseniciresistens]